MLRDNNYLKNCFNLPLIWLAHSFTAASLASSLVILAALLPSSLTGDLSLIGDLSLQEREACRSASLSSCEVPGNLAVTSVKSWVGAAAGCLEADLPEGWGASQFFGAEVGAGVGHSGKGGWGKMAGMSVRVSAGVLTVEDPPLSKAKFPRPERAVSEDSDSPEPSDLPVLGEFSLWCFPFLTPACNSSACLWQNSRSLDFSSAWWSVLLVEGFWGIRLHPHLCFLHCLHGPFGTTSQLWPPSLHWQHCHCLLVLSKLRGRWHTCIWFPSNVPFILSLFPLREPLASSGPGPCLDWVWCFAIPCSAMDKPFCFLVVAAFLEVFGLLQLWESLEISEMHQY